jgi:membrane peptidoglycan carboxypeptidase
VSRRRDREFIVRHNVRKKKRMDRIRRRRRTGVLLGALGIAVVIVVVAVSVGAGVALSAGCDLNSLRPANIGSNSFVFADDGSVLGSIPADKNREPVAMNQISPWLPKATVAIEDRRFYEHGGVDYIGIARAAWEDVTAGKRRVSRSSLRTSGRRRRSSTSTSTPSTTATTHTASKRRRRRTSPSTRRT